VEGFQKVEEESKKHKHALYQKDPKNATKGPSEDIGQESVEEEEERIVEDL